MLDTITSTEEHKDKGSKTKTKNKKSSPTKSKYRKLLQRERKRVQRLRQALNFKKKQRVDRKIALNALRTLLPERTVKFIEAQIALLGKAKHGKRYTPEMKSFALSLYHVSGKPYRLISKLFYLPSKRSLLNWVSGLPSSPGLSDEALKVIETKVKCMNEASRCCTISMDEISLKTSLLYDSTSDKVVDVEDFGNGRRNKTLATAADVFMARGISDNWKQPLAYFFVHESCPSDIIKQKL